MRPRLYLVPPAPASVDTAPDGAQASTPPPLPDWLQGLALPNDEQLRALARAHGLVDSAGPGELPDLMELLHPPGVDASWLLPDPAAGASASAAPAPCDSAQLLTEDWPRAAFKS